MKFIRKSMFFFTIVVVFFCCFNLKSFAATKNSSKVISDVDNTNNHSFETATVIPNGKTIIGRNTSSKGNYYKFKTSVKGYVRFKVTKVSGRGEVWFYVYDKDRHLINEYDGITGTVKTQMLNFKKGTTFYIYIGYGPHGVDGTMDFRITPLETNSPDMEVEYNNSFFKATKLKLNTKHKGFTYYKDIDFYKFTASKDGKYNFTFNSSTGNDINEGWCMTLFKSNGKEIKKQEYVIAKTTLLAKMKKGETIYVKINPNPRGFVQYVMYSLKVSKSSKK